MGSRSLGGLIYGVMRLAYFGSQEVKGTFFFIEHFQLFLLHRSLGVFSVSEL